MTMQPDQLSPAGEGPDAVPASARRRRILDPLDRASEVLFGLIMVLTFTLSLGGIEAGRADVRAVLIGALGCNLAWAIIDAILYVLGARGARGLGSATVRAIRDAESPAAAQAIVAENLPPAVLPALTATDLERIRAHLVTYSRGKTSAEDHQRGLCRGFGGLSPRLPLRLSSRGAVPCHPGRGGRIAALQCRRHRAALSHRLRIWPRCGPAVAHGSCNDRRRDCPRGHRHGAWGLSRHRWKGKALPGRDPGQSMMW